MYRFLVICLSSLLICGAILSKPTDSKNLLDDKMLISTYVAPVSQPTDRLEHDLRMLESELIQRQSEGANTEYQLARINKIRSELGLPARPADPPLDDGGATCATATVINSVPYSDTDYTDDTHECYPYDNGPTCDVWYKLIAPWAGNYTIDLCGTTSPAQRLVVWTSGQCCTGSRINVQTRCSESNSSPTTTVNLAQGQTVIIQIGHWYPIGCEGTRYYLSVTGPAPPTGRCCYGDPFSPSCDVTTLSNCNSLGGTWSQPLTCSTPCPLPLLGRCCYGDPMNSACDVMAEFQCDDLGGNWTEDITCSTPCPPLDYCSASAQCDEHIARLQCGTIDHTSECTSYSDYSGLCTEVIPGIGTAITVTIGGSYGDDVGGLWIDWNNDLDFNDPGEELYDESSWYGHGPYTGTIVPPEGTPAGDYRMRVRIQWNEAVSPCGERPWGETEDYCLTVVGDPLGACCNPLTYDCVDGITEVECLSPAVFHVELTCEDIDCDPPCFECPDGTIVEIEQCVEYPDIVNGGCESSPPAFTPISCGDVVCGTGGYGSSGRDKDWYEVVITAVTEVTWSGIADGVLELAIFDITNGCPPTQVVAIGNVDECETLELTTTLLPGTYAFFAANYLVPEDCMNYKAWLTCNELCELTNYCENPIVIGAGDEDPPGTWNYSNIADPCCAERVVPFVWSDMCGGEDYYSSGDVIYQMDLTAETALHIEAAGPCDNQVMVFTSCDDPTGTCVASADNSAPPYNGVPELIDVTLSPGTYYIITSCYGYPSACEIILSVSGDHPLPVELISFDAVAGDESVNLNWSTASETNQDRFDILRNGTVIGQVRAANSLSGDTYTWTDRNLINGRTYTYELLSVDVAGNVNSLGTVAAMPVFNTATITEYALHQNYPNPFNPHTSIAFDLVDETKVVLTIYNPLGRAVATLVDGTLPGGRHVVEFDADGLTSGLYFYRLDSDDFTSTRKMVLMK